MTFRIALQSKPSPHVCDPYKNWQVLLNGKPWGDPFTYNMTGYRGVLPMPDGHGFDPGEVTLTQLRREVAWLNREAQTARPPAPASVPTPEAGA